MRRELIEAALRRRDGMNVEQRREIEAMFKGAADLYTTCQKCKKTITGTMSQLLEHNCDQASSRTPAAE